ncbi:iron-sulfur cluster biosynthesis family protein [Shouchella shacheensis]|uniref:iron-sulfur cluster biosynthesis family protein n=1 Tax=Shouchella shacheensis TaxID=1649580 RepID=UPI00074013FC|nr:iron-sulfur cluster biosynthesis family protein [Shouchella shacheensis]
MMITEAAKEVLQQSMEQENAEGIRFYSAGQGCCGPQFGVSLDAAEAGDEIKEVNGIKVAIDGSVREMAENVSLDFQNGNLILKGLPESNC